MKTLLRLLLVVGLGWSAQAAVIYPIQPSIGGSNAASVTFISTNIFNTFNATTITNTTFETTNVDIYNTLNLQSNVVVNLTTNVVMNVKGGSKIVMYVPSSLQDSNATANSIASWDALSQITNGMLGNGLVFNNNALSVNGDISAGTNVTIRYDTNAIPNTGALTFGHAYFTNLQASVTLAAFTLGSANYYESLALVVTNSTGADTTITMPAGVVVAKANGSGALYCTNKTRTTIYVEHYGTQLTNAWKNDF